MSLPLPVALARAVVVGGTHGNELTGAFLARHWRAHPEALARPGLDVEAVIANERAVAAVRRYVDKDLNRCFRTADLEAPGPLYEQQLAPSLRETLLAGHDPRQVAIFDLHTTTASMGKSLVLGHRAPFSAALAAFVTARDPEVRAYCWVERDAAGAPSEPGFISAVGPAGLAIEVGPIAGGVLDARILDATRDVVGLCLDFVEVWNGAQREGATAIDALLDAELLLYEHREHVDYPRDHAGAPLAVVHPDRQGRDFEEVRPGDPLFVTVGGEVVPYAGPPGRVAVFINEAAYYEKGIALTLTEPVRTTARAAFA